MKIHNTVWTIRSDDAENVYKYSRRFYYFRLERLKCLRKNCTWKKRLWTCVLNFMSMRRFVWEREIPQVRGSARCFFLSCIYLACYAWRQWDHHRFVMNFTPLVYTLTRVQRRLNKFRWTYWEMSLNLREVVKC